MTMNDTWGYKSYDDNWKPAVTLVRNLVDVASKGGNYLLNVGPTAEGLIPQPSLDRLAEVGEWMKANGEAIYATSASPFKRLTWGRCTQKPGKLYLHVFDWPKDGRLRVPLATRIDRAYLMADPGAALTVESSEQGATIRVPETAPDPRATVVVAEIDGAPEPLAASLFQGEDGVIRLTAAEAEIVGETARLEGGEELNIGYWTDVNDLAQWQVQVGKPGAFTVEVTYACDNGSGDGEYVVAIGDQVVYGKTEVTGGWQSYRTVKLGTIRLAKAGAVSAMLRGLRKPNLALMNLRSVVLTPADG
jgi:alpha-L-fucosidase